MLDEFSKFFQLFISLLSTTPTALNPCPAHLQYYYNIMGGHGTLHCLQFTLKTVHNTLPLVHYTQQTAHCTLHTVHSVSFMCIHNVVSFNVTEMAFHYNWIRLYTTKVQRRKNIPACQQGWCKFVFSLGKI